MYSKTVFAAAALAASVAAYDMPSCWSSCFAQYQVDSEGCLCSDALGSVVSSCIQSGCSPDDNTAYSSWLTQYCDAASPTTNTWTAPVSSVPATYSSEPPSTTAPPPSSYSPSEPTGSAPPASGYPTTTDSTTDGEPTGYSTPVSTDSTTDGAPSGYPTSTETSPVSATTPTGYTSSTDGTAPPYPTSTGSFCTSTSTLIYRSSTAYATYTVTPGAYGTGAIGGYGTAAPTGGVSPSGYSPVPATGGASKVGAGIAMMIGALALLI